MATNTYSADTIGEAIDEAVCLESTTWGGPPNYLEIVLLGEEAKKD